MFQKEGVSFSSGEEKNLEAIHLYTFIKIEPTQPQGPNMWTKKPCLLETKC